MSFNPEAEKSVLASIILDNSCLDSVNLSRTDFYNNLNRDIFTICKDLEAKDVRIDLISLTDELKRRSINYDVVEIAKLSDYAPSSANVEYYCEIVKDMALRRSIKHLEGVSSNMRQDETVTALETIETIEKMTGEMLAGIGGSRYKKIAELVAPMVERIEVAAKTGGAIEGVNTFFPSLDRIIGGFNNSEMTVIGARPSMGKTSLILSIIDRIAIKKKIPCGVFSIEMSEKLLMDRLVSQVSGIASVKIKRGMLTQADFSRLSDAGSLLFESPIYVDDTTGLKMQEIRSKARRMVYKDGVKIIFIDYFGLITPEGKGERFNQMSEVSRQIKGLAKELDIPIVLLSQVNRDKEGKRPCLADLRETGSLEQDADMVLFLHREREYGDDAVKIETEVLIAKNRNGSIGLAHLDFEPSKVRFIDREDNIKG